MSNFGTLQSEDSPGPEVFIKIFNPVGPSSDDANSVLVKAIIDTGADTSTVPEDIIKSLIEKSGYELENDVVLMTNADGSTARFYLVRVAVSLYDHSDYAKYAFIPSQEYAIIGRDFLGILKISFDFSAQNWWFCNAENCSPA
jgi:predicted aspartyl protease